MYIPLDDVFLLRTFQSIEYGTGRGDATREFPISLASKRLLGLEGFGAPMMVV